ncbi:MAG: hypothetical protein JNM75_11925 [Rhodospirillales bacterium]|nr:hypothetical protein [Rhodospirillales bacterium]
MTLPISNKARALLASAVIVSLSVAVNAEAAITCVAPPPLSNPIVIDGKCPGDPGFPKNLRADGRDVFIKLPSTRACSQGMVVARARNVRITGGQFIYNDSLTAVITIKDTAGVALVEGVSIDVNKKFADAIRSYNDKGRLIVQNTFVRGISGTTRGTHGDLVHAQSGGPLQELILQNVTGLTGYQGLFSPYRPSVGHGTRKLRLDRVNVGYDPSISKTSGARKPLMLLFMGSADDTTNRVPDRGTTLTNVFVDGSYWNFAFQKAVYAQPKPVSGGCATFEPKHKVSGRACGGRPADGDFAPAARVGRRYNRGYFCN